MSTLSTQKGFKTFPNRFVFNKTEVDGRVFGEKVGFVGKFFGCWHEEISRPFSHEKTSYRSCLKCGARKQFDAETLRTFGSFYFPPIIRKADLI